ncbi:hypothetical protein Hanom_Chr01g00071961 [Helianthus anomalus]
MMSLAMFCDSVADVLQLIKQFLQTLVIDVNTNNHKLRISNVFFTPDITRNILSLDQLIKQGFVIKISGDICVIVPMFETPNDHNVLSLSQSIEGLRIYDLEKEEAFTKEEDAAHEQYKNDHVNAYCEELNQESILNLGKKDHV